METSAIVVLSFLVSYWSVSLLLFYNPMLHKKKKETLMSKVKNMSHRGGSIEGPENTIAAFEKSLSNGAEMLEMDVHLTRDGQVVVFHDAALYRVTGEKGLVSEYDYNFLPKKLRSQLPVPFPEHFGQFIETDEYDTHIPTLEEVFQKFPNVPINLDLKATDPLLVEKVSQLIKKYNREDLVVWGSFHEKNSKACYKANPNVPMYFSFRGVVKLCLLNLTGLLPLVPLKESFLEIPLYSKNGVASLLGSTWKSSLFYFVQDKIFFRKSLFKHLNKRGITVFSWVQNNEEEFEYCFKKGVNGIITDTPSLLNKYLNSR